MIKKKTIKLVFGAVQVLFACAVMVLAVLLKFDAFNVLSLMLISEDVLNFYVVILLAVGFVSVVGGLFLIHDWWKLR